MEDNWGRDLGKNIIKKRNITILCKGVKKKT